MSKISQYRSEAGKAEGKQVTLQFVIPNKCDQRQCLCAPVVLNQRLFLDPWGHLAMSGDFDSSEVEARVYR